MICSVCKDKPVRFFEGRLYVQCCVCGPGRFERMLRENMPQSISVLEWATYNQWASEQRTAQRIETENQKEQKS